MRPAVTLQAFRPTAAALPWAPVLLAGGSTTAVAALVGALSDRPGALATLGGAALASGAVAALHDPAARLLAPLPPSVLARRALRLALVTAVVVPLLAVLRELSPAPESIWATTLALALTGLALATWLPGDAGLLVAAAAPVGWVVATRLTDGAGPLDVWADHPWPLAGTAVVAIVVGRHR